MRLPAHQLKQLRVTWQCSLLQNATSLMGATFVTAFLGFLFWTVVTNTYDATTVGLATTLITISSLVAALGLLGFETVLVRFLPREPQPLRLLHTAFAVTGMGSFTVACIAVLAIPLWSPALHFMWHPIAAGMFIAMTVITSLCTLAGSIFLAHKQAHYILATTIIFSLWKLLMPLIVTGQNALTLYVLATSGYGIGLGLYTWLLRRKHGYTVRPQLSRRHLGLVRRFSLATYASTICNLLPATLLPLLIVSNLPAANAAYFYMAFTIASALYAIAYATMQSLFAEGSHRQQTFGRQVKKALLFAGLLLLPACLTILTVGEYVLQFFGGEYVRPAGDLLHLFVMSAIPVAGYSALGAIFKVRQELGAIVGMSGLCAVLILGGSYLLIPTMGLVGVGWAWLVGNIIAGSFGWLFLLCKKRGNTYEISIGHWPDTQDSYQSRALHINEVKGE